MLCLDSDILIGHLRKRPEALQFLQEHESNGFVTTIITKFELLVGAKISQRREENLAIVRALISRIPSLDFGLAEVEECSEIFAGLQQRGKLIEMRDIFIGGTCRRFNIPLVTRNIDHFKRIEKLNLIQW